MFLLCFFRTFLVSCCYILTFSVPPKCHDVVEYYNPFLATQPISLADFLSSLSPERIPRLLFSLSDSDNLLRNSRLSDFQFFVFDFRVC
jgi:hypothetical protein